MAEPIRIPLTTGAYSARSVISSAQRSVNLFAQMNPEGSSVPVVYYPTPGLRLLATAGANTTAGIGCRGLFRATNGSVYGVWADSVYYISDGFVFTLLGTIPLRPTPVSMVDNGTYLVIVDGSTLGWTILLSSNAFAALVDPSFVGANAVQYLDTFLLFNQPGTRNLYSSLSNSITFDPTYIAAKTVYPDLMKTLRVVHRDLWLFGTDKSEIWYNSGSAGLPFAATPGVYSEHGIGATYSVASHDEHVFWLGQDLNGKAVVLHGTGYKTTRISNHGVEYALAQYPDLSDARSMIYQQEGSIFYMLSFPLADKTWVFDLRFLEHLDMAWHERTWTDNDGAEHRHRAGAIATGYGVTLVGDWQNGNLYQLDLNTYTDVGQPIVRRRGFPHIMDKGFRVSHGAFQADMEAGNGDGSGVAPQVYLRWSDDRGKSYGNPMGQSLGAEGEYLVRPTWWQLGYAVDRVFELFWSSNSRTALQGAFVLVNPNDPNAGPMAKMLAQSGRR